MSSRPGTSCFSMICGCNRRRRPINAISKDGVSVTAQINVRYQLLHNSVAVLHKFIGPAYLATVIGPEIGSQAREVISQYTAQEVYTSRDTIQQEILANTQKSLGANLNKLVQPEAMEQPDPKHYNDFLRARSKFSIRSCSASNCRPK